MIAKKTGRERERLDMDISANKRGQPMERNGAADGM